MLWNVQTRARDLVNGARARETRCGLCSKLPRQRLQCGPPLHARHFGVVHLWLARNLQIFYRRLTHVIQLSTRYIIINGIERRVQLCERPSERVGHALQQCGGCKTLYYCAKPCQQADWKHHKKECLAIKNGEAVPQSKRASVRVSEPVPAPDPDTVYYTKTSLPHVLDVSIARPFYPLEKMVEHIQSRCGKEGSLPALRVLKETIENVGIVSLEHLLAPLPGGEHMKIEIVREKNVNVAAFLRNCPPGTPRPVFMVLKQVPHPELEKIMAGSWPFEYVPTLDFEVIKSLLSKETANEEASRVLDSWKADKQPGDTAFGGLHEGLFLGQLLDRNRVQKQLLLVHKDDGKVVRNGVVGY
jgi:hypothetical protein